MQSEAEAVAASESCVLAAAERHMEGCPRSGGKCWECDNFYEIQAGDELPIGLSRQLDFCGACIVSGSVTIVDRSKWHSSEECWEAH